MDMPRAIQFRYFWLEILSSKAALAKMVQVLNEVEVVKLRDSARKAYVDYVAGEKERALKTSDPRLTDAERRKRAEQEAIKEVRRALVKWFDLSADQAASWSDALTRESETLGSEASRSTPVDEAMDDLPDDIEDLDGGEDSSL